MSEGKALIELFKSRLVAPDRRSLWRWSEDEVKLPPCYAKDGKFSTDRVRFLRAPAEALTDPKVREVVCMSAVQCCKTLLGELWLLHCITESPGPSQWLQNTDEEAFEHAEERFQHLLSACEPVQAFLSDNRFDRKTASIIFRHMFLRMEGTSLANLQRKSIKNQMCSEVWQWAPGRLSEAAARLTQFTHNSKRYIESQPGTVGDDIHQKWCEGQRDVWSWRCPSCARLNAYRWSVLRDDGTRAGIVWDENERTRKANGEWVMSELLPTVRMICPHCSHAIPDEQVDRRKLMISGEYVAQNPTAGPRVRSYSWNQLAMDDLPWKMQVERWLRAREQAKLGNEKPQTEFIQKVLGESHDPTQYTASEKLPVVPANITTQRKWEEEKFRFLTIDVQMDHFWGLVMGWSANGDSLAWWFGKLYSWEEVEAKVEEWKIEPQCVFVDCGYRHTEVYERCVRNGKSNNGRFNSWWALKGTDRDEFVVTRTFADGRKRQVRKPHSWPPQKGDPYEGRGSTGNGKFANVIHWSNPSIKDIAFARRDGRTKGIQTLSAPDITKEFTSHLYGERKVQVAGKPGVYRYEQIGSRPNHGLDCFCMSIVGACIARVIGSDQEE